MKRDYKSDLDKWREILDEKDENVNKSNDKATNTAFIIMFPSLIMAGFAAYFAPLSVSIMAVALAAYQFLLLKKFIEDYYKK